MGRMTKSTLLHINSGDGGTAGFGEAKVHANNALAAFEEPVWAPIKSRKHWSGVGQPDAESVIHTNVLAFNTSEALMEAGAAAMGAATLGFSALQGNMRKLDDYAKSLGSRVTENGKAVWDDNNPNKPDLPTPDDHVKQLNLTIVIQQTLRSATLLDLSTKASLQQVYDNAPEVVDNAADAAAALPKNKQTFVEALDSRRLILEVSASLSILDSTLVGVGDLKATGAGPLPDGILELNRELQNLIESGIGVTKAGPFLSALKGDLPALLVSGITIKADAAAKAASAAGKDAAAKLRKLPGRIAGVVGWSQFAGDLAVYLAGELAPEGEATSHPVVTSNGEVKAHVSNFELSHIASGFYFTHGYGGGSLPDASIADLARAQRLGAVEPGQYDYVEEAWELRSQLVQWQDTNYSKTSPDPGGDDPDYQYVEGLIQELNAALYEPVPE